MSLTSNLPRKAKRWERSADRIPAFVEHWGRLPFVIVGVILFIAGVLTLRWTPWGVLLAILASGYWILGLQDMLQRRQSILRNFPILGRLRYLAESVRPELRQYFVESDQEENPFSREKRSIIYQRSKNVVDTLPFGTRLNVYQTGYEWLNHSLEPTHPSPETARVLVGEGRCAQPYLASVFNVSAMSYGSLSKAAVRALNKGAKIGNFAHNTGEGGLSPYHLEHGGDLIWQIGTGYFSCRTEQGHFSEELFGRNARHDSIKMIEVKLSQGAKPAHGGILPARKVTAEVAQIRGVPLGRDVLSPPAHTAFRGPRGLLEFISRLRELSGGKPVGIKLCMGNPVEFMAIVKAMLETGLRPDYISIDGGEGGTGAAPLEFSNSVGAPLTEGLRLAHNTLVGAGIREELRVFSAGKISTGFHLMHQLAIGADACYSARAMMFALGCIQALKCNSNKCPVGVATQDPKLVKGLDVDDKAIRVANFHKKTVDALLELTGAAGLDSPADLHPELLIRRISQTEVKSIAEIYPTLEWGCLTDGRPPPHYARWWNLASSDRFRPETPSRPRRLPLAE
ncbi:MAG: FMN-binding glutamate synthase family protein [Myxococcota bacterium]